MDIGRLAQKTFLLNARKERLTPEVYASLISNLFCGTTVSYVALAVASMTLASVNLVARPSLLNAVLLAAMTVITGLRIALMVFFRRWKKRGPWFTRDYTRWEALYAIHGVIMMAFIGFLSVATAIEGETFIGLLVGVVVVMGVIGGVAGRNGSRPQIVRFQTIAIMLPFEGALLAIHSVATLVVAGLILLYYFAMMASTVALYTALRTALVNESRNKELSRRIERSAALFDIALNNMTSGLLLFNLNRSLVVANERVKTLMGHELINGLMGKPVEKFCETLLTAHDTGREEADRVARTFPELFEKGDGSLTFVDHIHDKSFELRLKRIPYQGVVVNVDDITDKLKKEMEIRHLAHHDALTGLPNRFNLGKFIERCAERASPGPSFVMMYIDLDHFKEVNDQLGHAAGDSVLIEVAERLKQCTRPGDFVARLAGDEFVVIFRGINDLGIVTARARDIIARISDPYVARQRSVMIGASAGLCAAPQTEPDALELLRRADVALYEAKKNGRGIAMWYEHAMDARASTRREMTRQLRKAIENGELTLHYQPVIDFRSGQVVACEALARWTHERLGPVAPAVFIPLAEESDLIQQLGAWSLTQACLEAKHWGESVKVAVNISVSQFKHGSISALILDALRQTGLDPSRLEIEITESVLADDLDQVRKEMEAIASAGISIALDDFGTGYSSLSLLHHLPIDKVKLDGSFVKQLDEDPTTISLVASIVQMAQTMRKQLVIEGVETASQLALIAGVNARLVQGYYFSPPLPSAEIAIFLSHNHAATELGLIQTPMLRHS